MYCLAAISSAFTLKMISLNDWILRATHPNRILILLCIILVASSAKGLDLDHDGMSDVWQRQYNVATGDTDSDLDGDGYSNIQEALAGTNPRDASDYPRVTGIGISKIPATGQNILNLDWRSTEGVYYLVEESLDLIHWSPRTAFLSQSGQEATPNGQIIAGPGVTTSASLLISIPYPRLFYRVTATTASTVNSDGDRLFNWEEYLLGTNPLLTDTDGDGMPDDWEFVYGLNPLVNDASFDPDGDGLTNLQEYLKGTNPFISDAISGDQLLANSSLFSFSSVGDYYTSTPHYSFVGAGTYFLDSFTSNGKSGQVDGNIFYPSEFQTEIISLGQRLVTQTVLDSAMNDYATQFQTAQSENDTHRWRPLFSPLGNSVLNASAEWLQGQYPAGGPQTELTDASKTGILQFVTVQMAATSDIPIRTVPVQIWMGDFPIAEDHTDATDDSGHFLEPSLYAGTVKFHVSKKFKYPDVCEIPTGVFPQNVFSNVTVISAAEAPNPRAALKINLSPQTPNTSRRLLPIEFEDKTEWSGLDNLSPEKWLMIPQGGSNSVYIHNCEGFEMKMQPNGPTYISPTPSTTLASSRELITFGEGGILGDTESVTFGRGNSFFSVAPLRFTVKLRRELKVTVHPITLTSSTGQVLLIPQHTPSKADLEDYLNNTFGEQANVFCNVTISQGASVNWDVGLGYNQSTEGQGDQHFQILDPGLHDESDEEKAITTATHDRQSDVNVYFIAATPLIADVGAMWVRNPTTGYNSPVLGFAGKAIFDTQGNVFVWDYPSNGSNPDHKWTIAHEIGHFVGALMHSTFDIADNPGYLPGTDNELRLMTDQGSKRPLGPRQLIKYEWDQLQSYFTKNFQ